MAGVPIINANPIRLGQEPSVEELKIFGKYLIENLKNCGFIILTNHGIDWKNIDDAMRSARDFFEQPESTKVKTFPRFESGHGYIRTGKENIDQARVDQERKAASYEHREAFIIDDFGLPLPGDDQQNNNSTNMNLRRSYETFFSKSSTLGARLLQSLALGFGLPKDFFYEKHPTLDPQNSLAGIRSNYYPALRQEQVFPEGTVRCGEHKDFGTLTMVYQGGGLQVKHPTAGWIDVGQVDNGIVVNVALQLERWTAGTLPASLHRVLAPSPSSPDRLKPRQSLVHFIIAHEDTVIQPVVEGPRRDEFDRVGPIVSGGEIERLLRSINYF